MYNPAIVALRYTNVVFRLEYRPAQARNTEDIAQGTGVRPRQVYANRVGYAYSIIWRDLSGRQPMCVALDRN